ncbi:MAG: hypothetical protein KDA32_01325 [Phycisphaerales bacterium]|nr:hypothetical protein [Phycisphaerales bacterium]
MERSLFPPVLIPIWDDWPRVHGLWRYPDSLCRSISFVQFDADSGSTVEIGRNAIQFLEWFALYQWYNLPGDEEFEELETFCAQTGVDFQTVDRIGRTNKYWKDAVPKLPSFSTSLPLSAAHPGEYDGDFPVDTSAAAIARCSFWEFPESQIQQLQNADNCPPWLRLDVDASEAFEKFLNGGDTLAAWLCLNRFGWRGPAMGRAFERFAGHVDPITKAVAARYRLVVT